MPRKLRVQFEGGIDHAMWRGNARQDIVADDRDRRHFLDRLGSQVRRSGWELIRLVLLSNHFPLLVRTPRPDLASCHDHDHLSPTGLARTGHHALARGVAAWLDRGFA